MVVGRAGIPPSFGRKVLDVRPRKKSLPFLKEVPCEESYRLYFVGPSRCSTIHPDCCPCPCEFRATRGSEATEKDIEATAEAAEEGLENAEQS